MPIRRGSTAVRDMQRKQEDRASGSRAKPPLHRPGCPPVALWVTTIIISNLKQKQEKDNMEHHVGRKKSPGGHPFKTIALVHGCNGNAKPASRAARRYRNLLLPHVGKNLSPGPHHWQKLSSRGPSKWQKLSEAPTTAWGRRTSGNGTNSAPTIGE